MKPDDDIILLGCKHCELDNGKYVCYDHEEATKCFWSLSLTKNLKQFDFKTNLENMQPTIQLKLAEHGLLGWQEYKDRMEEVYGSTPTRKDLSIKQEQGHVWIDEKELEMVERKCIAEGDDIPLEEVELYDDMVAPGCLDEVYEHISDRLYDGYYDIDEFKRMKKIHDEIDTIDTLTQSEKVNLFDKVIHLAHLTGTLFDMNISELRRDFEKDIGEKKL